MDSRFPREARLLVSREFNFVFEKSKKVRSRHITILSRPNVLSHPRMGLAVAKKNLRHAHERNRVKRLARESFRLHQHKLPSVDFILLANKGIDCIDNLMLSKSLGSLWRRYYH